MAPLIRLRDPVRASIWTATALTFVGIGVSAAYPHPWLSPEATIVVTLVSFTLAVLSFVRAFQYWYLGAASTGSAVSYPQFMKTREQLRREIAERDDTIQSLSAKLMILEAVRPREITQEQRERIHERLVEGQATLPPEVLAVIKYHTEKVIVAPLANAPDGRHLAEALYEILSFHFDVTMLDINDPGVRWHSTDDVQGILLLEPHRRHWYSGRFGDEFNGFRSRCVDLIADSFTSEGVRIDRRSSPAIGNFDCIVLLVGRRP